MSIQDQKRDIALDLYEIGAVNFGEFTYVSGLKGPIYIDLRILISHPRVLKKVAKVYAYQLAELDYDRMAGVAYAALPIAGAISLELEKPWIFMRKEGLVKSYGLKKALEGEYNKGETVVMIEDLVLRATSLLQAIPPIREQGLKIKDAVVLLDYQKGGSKRLQEIGCTLHAFMNMHELVDIMKAEDKIDELKHQQSISFLET